MTEAETAYFRGEGGVIWTLDLPLPEAMAEKVTKGYLTRCNPDGSTWHEPAPEGEGPVTEQPPVQTAPKKEWVGYAVRVHNVKPDDAEAMTKQDLVEKFGQ